MTFYSTFFNDENQSSITMDENSIVKMNMNKFNLHFFETEAKQYYKEQVTSYELIIEKEIEGNYVFNNKAQGILEDGIVSFQHCALKDSSGDNLKYRIYIDFKQGGLTVFTTKDRASYILLKTTGSDFHITIHDAIEINNIFELQKETNDLRFDVEIPKSVSTFSYFFYLSNKLNSEEVIRDSAFIPLSGNRASLSTPINASQFSDNLSYLHFYLKDSFGNVSHNVVRITTKVNTLTLFSILNPEVKILTWEEEFGILFESRNITSLKPVIQYQTKIGGDVIQVEGKKVIGTYDKGNKNLLFNLNEYFEEIEVEEFSLFFVLNNDTKLVSNEVKISYDKSKPSISITNIEDNYKLISDESVTKFHVTGKIVDKNFFFVGNSVKKISPSVGKHYLLIQSDEPLKHVDFNGEIKELLRFNKYYYCETKGENFRIFSSDNRDVTSSVTYINDYPSENYKTFYIWFHKKDMTMYETNIIRHQGGLELKGNILSVLVNQTFIEMEDFFVVKTGLRNDANDAYSFDVGINDFEYSFLYKVNPFNISCELNNKKQLVGDFSKTKLLLTKSFKPKEVFKFSDRKVISRKKGIHDELINLFGVSLKEGEYYSPNSNFLFFDDEMNSVDLTSVYYSPILKKSEQNILYKNYICKQINDSLYNFEMDVEIEDGVNEFSISFEDTLGNIAETSFSIEKNYQNISTSIYMEKVNGYNVYEKNKITTNRNSILVYFVIENETKQLKTNDQVVRIKKGHFTKQQIIQNENDKRIAVFEVNPTNQIEEYEIYYGDLLLPIGTFTVVQKNELTLNTVEKFISGFNHYYLQVQTDDFSSISFAFDNTESFQCSLIEGNIIDIFRFNNTNIAEEIELEITVYDKNGLFNSVSKVVRGTFYNENIIENYKIKGHTGQHHDLIQNSFDLEMTMIRDDAVEYIRYYDKAEIDINKRFKYAKKEDLKATIESITTPIFASPIELDIKLKDLDLNIKKVIFQENPVSLQIKKEPLVATFVRENDMVIATLKSTEKGTSSFSKIEFIKQGNVFHTENAVEISGQIKYSFPISLFKGKEEILVLCYNSLNKISFSYSELMDFEEVIEKNAYLKGFDSQCVKLTSQLTHLELITELKDKNTYLLKSIDVYNQEEEILLVNNNVVPVSFNAGVFTFELYVVTPFSKKIVKRYFVEIIDSFEDMFFVSKEYVNFRYIEEIRVESSLAIDPSLLDSYIFFRNKEIEKYIYPEKIEGKIIYFRIPKMNGTNEYTYVNKYVSLDLPSAKVKEVQTKQFKILGYKTQEETPFVITEEGINVSEKANIEIKVQNCDKIKVFTKDGFYDTDISVYSGKVVVLREYLPCRVEFIKDDWKIKEIQITLDEVYKEADPLEELDSYTIDKSRFEIRSLNIKRQEMQILMKNRTKHFLMDYAMLFAPRKWKEQSVALREEWLSEIAEEVFEELREINVDEIKSRIRKRLGEMSW